MTLNQFDQLGVVGPIEIFSKEELVPIREEMLQCDTIHNLMNTDYRCKSNVLFPWVNKVVNHPKLVACVAEILGPNFHCWDTLLWFKKPNSNRDVGFHQDATYWNFDNRHLAVTAWFTFDDADSESGSVEYITGSHKNLLIRHTDIKTDTNLLMRGQTADIDIPKQRLKTVVPAGNIMLHSPFIVHGSGPNISNSGRYAMGMVFVSTQCKPVLKISPESTVMVSGVDNFKHMIHDPKPTGDWETDLKNWKLAYDRQHDNYYQMEQRNVV
jgi:ectoine hydroxylase-related dioxygenase (phytanoyl-CoA dioxygenase family)